MTVALAAALVPGTAGLAAASVLPPGSHPSGTNLSATPSSGPTVVSAVPATTTPRVNNGSVDAIATVGSLVILGGDFSSIDQPAGGGTVTQTGIVAFDAATGAIDTAFAPSLNGPVTAILPGPTAGTVYVGGSFSTVNGVTAHLALLNVATGLTTAGWVSPTMNGQVNALALAHGQLIVGGAFANVASAKHQGLVSLSPTTGAVTSYLGVLLTGHHGTGTAVGGVGARGMAVSPNGTRMVVVGNFTTATDAAGALARDQVLRITLGTSSGVIDRTWNTVSFTSQCFNNAFDSDMNGVAYSPEGNYFVIVTTGGNGTNSDGSRALCDAASSWSATATGSSVKPTWVDYTGQDTLLSVAISAGAVYVGGHQRWMNNSTGADAAGEGAVPRPSIAALDPASGLPLAWNPGHNPRGAGVSALLLTSSGLYLGSDTDYIGNRTYLRPKIAFFPLAGGSVPASTLTATLPGDLFVAGPTTNPTARLGKHLTKAGLMDATLAPDSTLSWDQTRGAFVVGSTLFYGNASGQFFRRSITQSTLGSEVAIDPYDDPTWSSVLTGSPAPGDTYQGVQSSFYSEIPSLTSAFYSGGRIYYTLSGQKPMFSRAFTPDSGVVGADESTVADGFNWTTLTGAVVVGATMYYANSGDKELHAIAWSGTKVTGSSHVVDTSPTWSGKSLFAVSDPTPAPSPLAPPH